MEKISKIIGFLTILLVLTGTYITFNESAKMKIGVDESTFYIKYLDENGEPMGRFLISGVEQNRLFKGTSIQNRDTKGIYLETIYRDDDGLTIYRNEKNSQGIRTTKLVQTSNMFSDDIINNLKINQTLIGRYTPYHVGASIIDKYLYDGSIDDIELFPIEHNIEVFNAEDLYYRYTVDRLADTGVKRKLTGETELSFGMNMNVELQEGYRWAWIGWPYGSDSLSAQYKITSDYEVYNVRLFDPIVKWNWTIEGNSVYVDNDIAKIVATPHTITGKEEVEFKFINKQYGGNADILFGFNTSDIQPTTADFKKLHNETVEYSLQCLPPQTYTYTTSPKVLYCWNDTELDWEHSFDT